ncbi:hypothetical protein, partial [Ruegeria arenilitoris]|uniref:hypothetical protein n=1 Tax=Ruegeria arenilitoris TaxID=1173585 RepID=UPI001C2C9759
MQHQDVRNQCFGDLTKKAAPVWDGLLWFLTKLLSAGFALENHLPQPGATGAPYSMILDTTPAPTVRPP